MAKGIFTTKAGSGYDDDPTSRYHFPKQYLDKVRQTVGDLVIYYEPRRNGGRSAYIAVVRVLSVDADTELNDHYYARVDEYLNFVRAVPFRGVGGLFEQNLASEGRTGLSGDFRNAVRLVPDDQFETILAAGFSALIASAPQADTATKSVGFAEEPVLFHYDRPLVERLATRQFRDDAFARQVKDVYGATCALTGLSMRNGGGRSEVEAAHIKPVGGGHRGPDSVRNGLALTQTVHWMFDRGLVSIDSDYRILLARNLVPEPIRRLIHPSGLAHVPEAEWAQPHPAFLKYHRDHIFKEAKN